MDSGFGEEALFTGSYYKVRETVVLGSLVPSKQPLLETAAVWEEGQAEVVGAGSTVNFPARGPYAFLPSSLRPTSEEALKWSESLEKLLLHKCE